MTLAAYAHTPLYDAHPSEHSIEAPDHAGMTIDLRSIVHNYRCVETIIGPNRLCGAVVKADAYGLGAAPCSIALFQAGCRHFFVAYLEEALTLKQALQNYAQQSKTTITVDFARKRPDGDTTSVAIYVFNGPLLGQEHTFIQQAITPVLISAEQVRRWAACITHDGQKYPAVLHIDTGLNRTGIRYDEVLTPDLQKYLQHIPLFMLMSHVTSSDEKDNLFNATQRDRFLDTADKIIAFLKYRPLLSLSNSNAIGQLDDSYALDMVRPGSALYGLSPSFKHLKPVVRLWARIVQTKPVYKGETIGYAQTYTATQDMRIGILAAGYADGISRRITNDHFDAYGMLGSYHTPIIGRISMDVLAVDVTHIPSELVYEGARVEFINDQIPMEQFAKLSGTFPYEAQINLGGRLKKQYIEIDA